MRFISDQLGKMRKIPEQPKRVISLVPSQTAYLAWLGCDKEVKGITKFCVSPEKWFRSKTRVGGTKNLKHDIIKDLNPDLIIGNKEENSKEDIELLKDYPLWLSDVNNLEDAIDMMRSIGIIMHSEEKAGQAIEKIRSDKAQFLESLGGYRANVVYLIWRDPFMAAGKETFIDKMIEEAGFNNLITETRYPELSIEKIAELNPDYIFLSSEPYPFKEKHKTEWLEYFNEDQLRLVNAEPFSWYGSHLLEAFAYFAELHRELEK